MGAMRVNGALLDMKSHTAATVLQVTEDDSKLFSHFVYIKIYTVYSS